MEVFFTPLASDDPDRKFILFSYELNPKADVEKLADISSETATNVVKTCLKLRETNDFQKAMDSVIADIREQCTAKRCSMLLTDFEKREYTLLCEDYNRDDPAQVPLTAFLNEDFYRISEDLNGSNPIPRPFGLCFIDVNGLKATNDLKGH